MAQFKIITADDPAEFYVETPDGEGTESVDSGELLAFDYDGVMYFAVDCDGFVGMKPNVVYALGQSQETVVEEEDDDAEMDEEEEEETETDEEDEPEPH